MPKIEISGLFKSFGPKKVLRGSTSPSAPGIRRGDRGSGSGKSVLLKCILGLMRPDSGSIRIDGEESVDLRAARANGCGPNSACCSRARPCSTPARSGKTSPSGLIQGDRMAPA